MNKVITPVLLGADLNCYSVARAFHEAYGVVSHVFGKYAVGETEHSKIIKFTAVENLEQSAVLCSTLLSFAQCHEGEELYLFACTDEYQEAIIGNREVLQKYYFYSCPTEELTKKLIFKEAFYKMCETYSLPYPKTRIFRKDDDHALLEELGFDYPIIIKPSSSVEYWRTPFEGMKKVYTAQNSKEAEEIISAIYASGYTNSIILQDRIPGGEDAMYVLTAYSDKNAKVRMLCMGHVLLGEHTPKGLGNHVAIITENHPEISEKIVSFLEDVGYKGFANFDIMLDEREGSFKILEMNLRQGRSNYYVTASGANIAVLPVCDNHGIFLKEKYICEEENFWHTVPKKIIYNYIRNKNLKERVERLVSLGKEATTLFYPKDMRFNLLRSAYVFIHNMRYFKKFKIYR